MCAVPHNTFTPQVSVPCKALKQNRVHRYRLQLPTDNHLPATFMWLRRVVGLSLFLVTTSGLVTAVNTTASISGVSFIQPGCFQGIVSSILVVVISFPLRYNGCMDTDKPTQTKQNVKVVVTGTKTEPITDPTRIVGLIEFTPERKLVVYTNDPILAWRIMDGITVTIMGGEDVKRGEAVLFKRAYAEPGTERHFNFLGGGRHGSLLLQPIGLVVYPPLPHLIQVPLPSFSYRLKAEGHSATQS